MFCETRKNHGLLKLFIVSSLDPSVLSLYWIMHLEAGQKPMKYLTYSNFQLLSFALVYQKSLISWPRFLFWHIINMRKTLLFKIKSLTILGNGDTISIFALTRFLQYFGYGFWKCQRLFLIKFHTPFKHWTVSNSAKELFSLYSSSSVSASWIFSSSNSYQSVVYLYLKGKYG